MNTVSVVPAAEGWMVRCDTVSNELFFRTGAAAEREAKRMAQALAKAGKAARIIIHTRDGRPAAKFLCPPATADDAPYDRVLEFV